ncbi:MAG: PqqD family protein [Novosphingobium sp.]
MSGILAKDPARFVETAIDDETVVMSLESGNFFSLKDTARAIWDLIDGSRDEVALVAALAGDYPDADRAVLAGDVASFVGELRGAGLLA